MDDASSISPADPADDPIIDQADPADDPSIDQADPTDDVSINQADGNNENDDTSIYPADDSPFNPVHQVSIDDIQHTDTVPVVSSTTDAPGGSNEMRHKAPCDCEMCVIYTASKRFQRLFDYSDGQFGAAYARSSRVLSLVTITSTPQEVILVLKLAMNWLHRDALDASGALATSHTVTSAI